MSILATASSSRSGLPGAEAYGGSISAHAELPPALPPHPAGSTYLPFPHFSHRHSSPYPAAQSFSALGPPGDPSSSTSSLGLHVAHPRPPPRPTIHDLPPIPIVTEIPLIGTLPPTPEPSPPDHKVIFPATMVELAPPAEDGPYRVQFSAEGEKSDDDNSPRRLPSLRIDTSVEGGADLGRSKSTNHDTRGKLSQTNLNSNGKSRHRPRRSQTAYVLPTSAKMSQSRSADSRARLMANAGMPRSGSQTPYGGASSAGLSRALSDAAATPPRHSGSVAADLPPTDLGADGLEAKVVLLGSQGVGKTSLILRYTTRAFSPTPASATIGSSLHTRKLVHAGVRVKLQIWDTAGQERFRSMAPIYYRGAHVCILVYDISDRQSFEDVRSWLEELGKTVPKETVIFVAGAKIDLNDKRAVSLQEARATIRSWLKPPTASSSGFLLPASKLDRRASIASKPDSTMSSPTPSRSHSQGALQALESGLTTHSSPTPTLKPIMTPLRADNSTPKAVPFPASKGHRHRQSIKIVLPTSSTSPRQISFPALHSPTGPTSATTTDHDLPSTKPSSPPLIGHGVSGGRFSISGVLGFSRTQSMSGAVNNLARLAESNPVEARASSSTSSRSTLTPAPVRVRTESSPMLSAEAAKALRDARRKSEDWSSRSWRMGEGPSAAEALGEFGAGVKKKESEELLSGNGSAFKKPSMKGTRSRGSSLGRDSRPYGDADAPKSKINDEGWGVDVEGIRLGECSALSGQGVDALFQAISSLLVDRKDKLERERTLRHKNSIMLVDPSAATPASDATKGRYACCV